MYASSNSHRQPILSVKKRCKSPLHACKLHYVRVEFQAGSVGILPSNGSVLTAGSSVG